MKLISEFITPKKNSDRYSFAPTKFQFHVYLYNKHDCVRDFDKTDNEVDKLNVPLIN